MCEFGAGTSDGCGDNTLGEKEPNEPRLDAADAMCGAARAWGNRIGSGGRACAHPEPEPMFRKDRPSWSCRASSTVA